MNIQDLVQARIDQIVNRATSGRTSSPSRSSSRDVEMSARNDRNRSRSSDGIAQQAIANITRSNPNISRLTSPGLGGVPSSPNIDSLIRRATPNGGTSLGTATTSTSGGGRAFASSQPGTVNLGRVSTDTPPTVTINGVQYVPGPNGELRPAKGPYTPPAIESGRRVGGLTQAGVTPGPYNAGAGVRSAMTPEERARVDARSSSGGLTQAGATPGGYNPAAGLRATMTPEEMARVDARSGRTTGQGSLATPPSGSSYDTSFIKPYPTSPGQVSSTGQSPTPGNATYGRNIGVTPPPPMPSPGLGGVPQTQPRNAVLASGVSPPEQSFLAPVPQPGLGGVAPTANPKAATPSSNLGGRIADIVRNSIFGTNEPPQPENIQSMVQRRLMDAGVAWDNEQRQIQEAVAAEAAQPPAPQQPVQVQVVNQPPAGNQLPVIQGPTEMPPGTGTNNTGTDPNALPIIDAPTRLPDQPATGMGVISTTIPAGEGTAPAAAPVAPTTTQTVMPQGIIDPATSGLQLGNAQGVAWDTLGQWSQPVEAAAAKYGVDPRIIYAAIAMESGGVAYPDQSNAPNSSGLLQIEQRWHAESAAQLGIDLNTPEGQIEYFAALISGNVPGQELRGNTPLERYINNYQGPEAGQTDPSYTAAYQSDVETIMGMMQTGTATNPNDPNGSGLPVIQGPTEITPPGNTSGITPAPTQHPESAKPGNPNRTGSARYPTQSGTLQPMPTPAGEMSGLAQGTTVQQGDGMGIYAGPQADESWINGNGQNPGMFANGEGVVSTDYKQDVCTYNPDCCNGGPDCWYNSNVSPQLSGATNTVHPGYDVAAPVGTVFQAPMGGQIIGTSGNSSNPACISPAGTNECTWAADYGIVMDGGVDVNGNPIYINYDHVGESYVEDLAGQDVTAGTPLGTVGGEAHIHVEVHGYCEKNGKMVILDPSLVYAGYYETHSTCEGVA